MSRNQNTFNKAWKIWHVGSISFICGLLLVKIVNAFNHPIDIHIPTSEELIEIMDFDNSRPKEIELDNGEFASVYES